MKINIPEVTKSKYFGNISKAVWYEVSDEYNPYFLTLIINLLPNQTATINIQNRYNVASNPEYFRKFTGFQTQSTQGTTLELYHVPNYKSVFYAVLNQA